MALDVILIALALAGPPNGLSYDGDITRPHDAPMFVARRSCKAVSTCEEAVIMWCNGYSRADGDGDGIPCENVCRSRRQVNEIRAAIGC
jgi:hypothetical protein